MKSTTSALMYASHTHTRARKVYGEEVSRRQSRRTDFYPAGETFSPLVCSTAYVCLRVSVSVCIYVWSIWCCWVFARICRFALAVRWMVLWVQCSYLFGPCVLAWIPFYSALLAESLVLSLFDVPGHSHFRVCGRLLLVSMSWEAHFVVIRTYLFT